VLAAIDRSDLSQFSGEDSAEQRELDMNVPEETRELEILSPEFTEKVTRQLLEMERRLRSVESRLELVEHKKEHGQPKGD
jgi:hypothetical protein